MFTHSLPLASPFANRKLIVGGMLIQGGMVEVLHTTLAPRSSDVEPLYSPRRSLAASQPCPANLLTRHFSNPTSALFNYLPKVSKVKTGLG